MGLAEQSRAIPLAELAEGYLGVNFVHVTRATSCLLKENLAPACPLSFSTLQQLELEDADEKYKHGCHGEDHETRCPQRESPAVTRSSCQIAIT